MRCSNYDDILRMIIVENNYTSPPVLTKTPFRDDISCLYFQTSKRGLLREVISKTRKALRITLKYLILTFEKTKKHIPKRQQQTANTRNFQFLSTKKTREKKHLPHWIHRFGWLRFFKLTFFDRWVKHHGTMGNFSFEAGAGGA